MAIAEEGELLMAVKANKNYALSKLQERTSNNKGEKSSSVTPILTYDTSNRRTS